MSLLILLLVYLIGFLASFIGTSVGGGGLISIPALIFLGLSPQIAIATNKLGSLGMVTAGFYRFNKSGKVNFAIGVPIAALSVIGAYFGAQTLLTIPNQLLEKLIGVFILIILGIVLLNPNLGVKKIKQPGLLLRGFGYLAFLLVGFWGAFFGGGFGIFSIYILIALLRQTFTESAGLTNLLGIGIALMAIGIFALKGVINWYYGIPLVLGMVTGSYVGAGYAIKKGDVWVRRLFTMIVVASALKLLL